MSHSKCHGVQISHTRVHYQLNDSSTNGINIHYYGRTRNPPHWIWTQTKGKAMTPSRQHEKRQTSLRGLTCVQPRCRPDGRSSPRTRGAHHPNLERSGATPPSQQSFEGYRKLAVVTAVTEQTKTTDRKTGFALFFDTWKNCSHQGISRVIDRIPYSQ